jgi:hypothetical protein
MGGTEFGPEADPSLVRRWADSLVMTDFWIDESERRERKISPIAFELGATGMSVGLGG